MTQPEPRSGGLSPSLSPYGQQQGGSNLADILERVLDKGIVIVGDIRINLLDIELLTIKLRLLVASVDKAKEIGIDWWENDPSLSSRANGRGSLEAENRKLRAEVEELRRRAEESPAELPRRSSDAPRRPRAPEKAERAPENTAREPGREPRRPRRRPKDPENGDREP
ncbi:gas vesicle protein [Streptomyces sp. NPDC057798]|uniref:gas vesicle protein n=1 Tax=Streptomyces sp. NPDC057798 TaxID=3346252 RepID=UPI0036C454A2